MRLVHLNAFFLGIQAAVRNWFLLPPAPRIRHACEMDSERGFERFAGLKEHPGSEHPSIHTTMEVQS